MGWHRQLSLETLVRHRAAITALVDGAFAAALAAFMAIYIAAVALSIPGAGVPDHHRRPAVRHRSSAAAAAVVGGTIGATVIFPDRPQRARRLAGAAGRPARWRRLAARLPRGRLQLPPVPAPGAAVPVLPRQPGRRRWSACGFDLRRRDRASASFRRRLPSRSFGAGLDSVDRRRRQPSTRPASRSGRRRLPARLRSRRAAHARSSSPPWWRSASVARCRSW